MVSFTAYPCMSEKRGGGGGVFKNVPSQLVCCVIEQYVTKHISNVKAPRPPPPTPLISWMVANTIVCMLFDLNSQSIPRSRHVSNSLVVCVCVCVLFSVYLLD